MTKPFFACLVSVLLMFECVNNPSNNPAGSQPAANAVPIGTFLLDSEVTYSSNGTFGGYTKYCYNGQGRKSVVSAYDQNSVVLRRNVYQYDSRGLLTKEIDTIFPNPVFAGPSFAPSQWITVYEYDASDRLIGKQFYGDSEELSGFARFENNQSGLKVKYTVYSLDSVPTYWYTWQYDSRDSIIGSAQHNADSSLHQFDTYEYNQWGVWKYVLYYPDSTVEATAVMGYDSLGRMRVETMAVGGISQSYTFDYDSNGNMVSAFLCDASSYCQIKEALFYEQYLGHALDKRAGFAEPVASIVTRDWKTLFIRSAGAGLHKRMLVRFQE